MFRILAVAEGYLPTVSAKAVDPRGGPVKLKLSPHDLARRDPELVVRGRVKDDLGRPVAGAVIWPFAVKKGDSTRFGGLSGVDQLALTNAQGEFAIGVAEKGIGLHVQVETRGLARQNFPALPAGSKVSELKLGPGVTVIGKVVKDGKPLAGVAVGLAQQSRNAETFVGDFKISTDSRGLFTIVNVPANQAYFLYGLMDSCRPYGAIPAQPLGLGAHGTVKDVGTLTMQRGHRLSGRLALSDGKPVPEGTRVVISRQTAWDSQIAEVAPDGSFVFSGLPPEHYSLSTNVRGYVPSPKNASFDLLNRMGLLGTITGDITSLNFLMEPGSRSSGTGASFRDEDFKEYQRRQNSPLQGALTQTSGKRTP